jgi:hypothetical protein
MAEFGFDEECPDQTPVYPIQIMPTPVSHPHLFAPAPKKKRVRRKKDGQAEDPGTDLAAMAEMDDLESSGTENSEDRQFIDNCSDIYDIDTCTEPSESYDDEGRRRKTSKHRPGMRGKRGRGKKTLEREATAAAMAAAVAAAAVATVNTPITTPLAIRHVDALTHEEVVRRNVLVHGAITENYSYHCGAPSLHMNTNAIPTIYDLRREEIDKCKEAFSAVVDQDLSTCDDVALLVDAAMAAKQQTEMLSPVSIQEVIMRRTVCKLCGFLDVDAAKNSALNSAMLAQEDDMQQMRNGGMTQAQAALTTDYKFAAIAQQQVNSLGRQHPLAASMDGEAFYWAEIYSKNPNAPELTWKDIYNHFHADEACTLDPRFINASMIRKTREAYNIARQSLRIKNAQTGDESVNAKAVTSMEKLTKTLKELYSWKASEMSYYSQTMVETNALITAPGCIAKTGKKLY